MTDKEHIDAVGEAPDSVLPDSEGPYVPTYVRGQKRHRTSFAAIKTWFAELEGWKRYAYAAPAILLLLLLLVVGVELAATLGRIHPGVEVAGVSVGGMRGSTAAVVLEDEISARMEEPVFVVFEERSWSITATEVAAVPEIDRMVDEAMAVGRKGGLGARINERFNAWFEPVDLPPVVSSDPDSLNTLLDTVDGEVSRAPSDAEIVIEGTTATLVSAEVGVAMRREDVGTTLLETFATEETQFAVPVDFVPVSITDADAEDALYDAEAMMSGPVEVTYADEAWEFSAEEVGSWIRFRAIPVTEEGTQVAGAGASADDGAESFGSVVASIPPGVQRQMLEAYIDSDVASETVTPRVGEAGKPAVDATFKVRSGEVSIVPSEDGVGPDVESLADEMTFALTSGRPRSIELRTMRVEPDLTTDEAQAMGIRERISTYTTHFSASNKPRVNNIHTLADALDGTLLAPGETFSFNGTIGPRTAAKGYQEAGAIVNGELVPQLGGGICQVGTTIFNTVFESGLPVLERRNHSFYISHYPAGRDATVSWGGPDFKFQNDTEDWVLIATGYSSSSLTISLYGTDPGYDVTSSTGSWTNVKAFPVEEIEDATLPEGTRIVEDGGVEGKTLVVKRTVKKDGTVVREDSFTSVYRPKKEIVRIGTLPVSEPSTESAEPGAQEAGG